MEKRLERKINVTPQIIFASVITGFIIVALVDSIKQSFLGGVFPLAIAIAALPFIGVLLWILAKGDDSNVCLKYDYWFYSCNHIIFY